MDQAANCPIHIEDLRKLCTSACDTALSTATAYVHSSTQQWNNGIIQAVLKGLIDATSKAPTSFSDPIPDPDAPPAAPTRYKFIVNSNIIQHLSDPREGGSTEEGVSMGGDAEKKVGRRGMHSASGAYWNNVKDGMWSCKYEGGSEKGMDVVVSVMWVGI